MFTKHIVLIVLAASLTACGAGSRYDCKDVSHDDYPNKHDIAASEKASKP